MDAGMISESSQLAPVTEESEEGLFSLDSEDEEEGLEKVECPKRAMPAKPGVPLFGTIHKTKEFDDEELKNMMKMQHVEVLQRFDRYEQLLRDLRENTGLASTAVSRRNSVRKVKSKRVSLQLPKQAQALVPRKPTFTPKLFSSLTQADMMLKKGAAEVDAGHVKAKQEAMMMRTETTTYRTCLQNMVLSSTFDMVMAAAILTNTVFIGVEVQWSISNPGMQHLTFQVIRDVYTLIFTVELFLRLAATGCDFFCSGDWRWNLLDLVIVLSSWWETFIELSIYTQGPSAGGGLDPVSGMTGLRTLRIVRITRLVKIARITRVLRVIMALRTLTQSIIYTLKSLIWAMILLVLIVYVFGILFAQAVNDHLMDTDVRPLSDEEVAAARRYFDDLPQTMLSLFMSIAGGVSWEEVIVPLRAISVVWVAIFLTYVSFTYFAVLNVVTGVFCQSAIDSAQSDHDMVLQSILANKQAHIEKIRYLFSEIDQEDSGVITFQMFQDKISSREVLTYFESIDLDIWDAWSFFKLLDLDSGGAIEIEEFLMGCLRLRGNARAMDMAKLCHDQAWLIRNSARFWNYVEEELNRMKLRMSEMIPSP